MVRENGEYKGKINWFNIHQLIRDKIVLSENQFIRPTAEQQEEIKNKCVEHLKKIGFVFFENYIGHRIKLRKNGKIDEFGVQFWHIK